MNMWPLVTNIILIVSVVIGIPAFVAVLWSLLRRRREGVEQGYFQRAVVRISRAALMAFGAVFVLGGVFIPLAISQKPPIRDEALIRIAPQFARPEFNLVYTSTFGANAELKVEPSKQDPDSVCLTLSKRREGKDSYGGWMIIFWAEFLYKFFKELGYPEAGRNLAQYSSILSFQAKGEKGGEELEVAIKDKTEDRHEERYTIKLPKDSTDWQPFELDLRKEFEGVDFSKIETISFSMNKEQSLCIKDIKLR